MMVEEFRLEDPGEGIHEAEIIEIHVAEGDSVADGDIILTVETDKAAVEVPAPFSGRISEIRVAEGEVVEIGAVLLTYESEEEAPAPKAERRKEEKEKEKEEEKPRERAERAPARAAAEEAKEQAAEKRAAAGRRAPKEGRERPVPASPATRRLARELDVSLATVEPSGAHGRVTADDVRAAAAGKGERAERRRERPAKEAERERAAERALPDFARWGEVEREPLRSIRRATAHRMARAWAEIPHVTHHDVADITELERFRREHADAVAEEGGKLTLTVLAMKAAVAALKEHPRFNASLDADAEEIILKHYYNIGVAIDTEAGLYVPVVREADRKSLIELSVELVELAEKARAGKLARDDMHGGSFTITNPGPLGGRVFTPIINHPEVAILGLAQAHLAPQVEGDLDDYRIVPRLLLPVCVAFDHRVNDGADAARFTRTLIETLSDADTVILHL